VVRQHTTLAHGTKDVLLTHLWLEDDEERFYLLLPVDGDESTLDLWITASSPSNVAFADAAREMLAQILLDVQTVRPCVAQVRLITT